MMQSPTAETMGVADDQITWDGATANMTTL